MSVPIRSDETAPSASDAALLEDAHRLLRIGGWAYEAATDTLRWTGEMYHFFELSSDHTPQLTTFVQFCEPSAQSTLRRALMRALDTGAPFDLELPFLTASGHVRWGRVLCKPDEADGQVTRLTGTLQDITERKDAEKALADERDLLDRIMDTSAMAIAVVDTRGYVVFANDRAATLLRDAPQDASGTSIEGMPYLPPAWTVTDLDDQPLAPDAHLHRMVIRTGAPVLDYRCAVHRPDGTRRILAMRGAPLTAEMDCVVRVAISVDDITERKTAENELRAEREFLDTLLDQMHAGVVACDAAGRITVMNRTAKRWHGRSASDKLPDAWPEHHLFHLSGTPIAPEDTPMHQALGGKPVRATEMIIATEDGAERIVECSGQPLRTGGGALRGAVVVMHDVTGRRTLEDRLHYQTHHDPLTDLPNRKYFLQRCEQAIERRRTEETPYAVLFLDLDRFKSVNDSLGHHAGDALLQAVAQRIQQVVRDGDFVARLGGDEFAVLLHPAPPPEAIEHIAERLDHTLSTPFELQTTTAHTAASIGIAHGHARHRQPEDALREADMAMYRAKLRDEGPRLFEPSLGKEVRSQFFLEADLYRALQMDEFDVAYQPIVRLADGALIGFEALVRWKHPQRGLLMPSAFIGVAETSGLITDIDRWMIKAACQHADRWTEQFGNGAAPLVHINCTQRTFLDTSLGDYVARMLDASQFPPERIALEITEREIVEDMDRLVEVMRRVKQQNLHLCIDDFGVKYSSLGVLQQLPVDTIKVDRSFIQRIDGSGTNQEIVQMMADLAKRMGLSLVAEGIETLEQLTTLQRLGYPLGQGHLVARPLDPEDATACIAGKRPWMTHWDHAAPHGQPLPPNAAPDAASDEPPTTS